MKQESPDFDAIRRHSADEWPSQLRFFSTATSASKCLLEWERLRDLPLTVQERLMLLNAIKDALDRLNSQVEDATTKACDLSRQRINESLDRVSGRSGAPGRKR